MNIFKIQIVACNPKDEGRMTAPLEALVDTASDWTWLPSERLRDIGVTPRHKRLLPGPKGKLLERETGYAILQAGGYETTDDVVFAEAGDAVVIGVRTMEGLGVAFDDVTHRFISMEALAAFGRSQTPLSKAA